MFCSILFGLCPRSIVNYTCSFWLLLIALVANRTAYRSCFFFFYSRAWPPKRFLFTLGFACSSRLTRFIPFQATARPARIAMVSSTLICSFGLDIFVLQGQQNPLYWQILLFILSLPSYTETHGTLRFRSNFWLISISDTFSKTLDQNRLQQQVDKENWS